MDIKQLKYFVAIIEGGTITGAAKLLHVSQPPLSNQMRLLENEPGAELFRRGARHITLTVAGDIVSEWPVSGELYGITINGVDVVGVTVGDVAYDLTLPVGSVVSPKTVKVSTVGSPDVNTTVTAVPLRPGYDVVVSVDGGAGAATAYTVSVTVPAA